MSSATPSLILIRHGQASLGARNYDQLSPLGQRQAMVTGRRLASMVPGQPPLWAGTHRRHQQTVAELDITRPARIVPALDEFSTYELVRAAIHRADRIGVERPDNALLADPRAHLPRLLEWFPDVLNAWQRGELAGAALDPWSVFRDRVLSPVQGWRDELMEGRSVVVVSSAGVISTLVAELTGRGLDFQRRLAVSMYNASVSQLYPGYGSWQAGVINCTDHLDADDLVTLA